MVEQMKAPLSSQPRVGAPIWPALNPTPDTLARRTGTDDPMPLVLPQGTPSPDAALTLVEGQEKLEDG